jgi:hypothetical protein
MRPATICATAVAVVTLGSGIGTLGALATLTAAPSATAGTASKGPSAQAEYKAAIKAIGTKGVHFESTAVESSISLKVVGDTGATTGAQELTVKNGKITEHMSAVVVGATGYVNGNAAALHHVIGLSNGQSSKYAGQWLSFPTSNSSLEELVGGLLNSQVGTELQMSGPYTYSATSTVHGQHALAVRGYVSSESGSKVPVVLYVPSTGSPLPIEEVTNPGKGGSSIHGTVTFSKWGELTAEKAPGHSVSLLKLVPSSSGTTTTTG